MKKMILISVLLLAILSLSAVSAHDNLTAIASDDCSAQYIIKESEIDSSNNLNESTNIGSFDEIDYEISKNENGSTISLSKDYVYQYSHIIIKKQITIDGQGHTLDANNQSQFMEIKCNNVVLKNINFINGNTQYNPAILLRGENCTILNCSFNNNYGIDFSIVDFNVGNGNIINSTFANTHNTEALSINNACNVINCTFLNNDGGAVTTYSDGHLFSNCEFINNSAENGGAINIFSTVEKIINCTFENNTAKNGGAIYSKNQIIIINCKFKTETDTTTFPIETNTTNQTETNTTNQTNNENMKTFRDLNNLINGNNDTEIYLNENYTYHINESEFSNGITINRDVTINGNGFTIDGNHEARIFNVESNNVVFKDLIFINGYVSRGDGGAINGLCTAINCTFKNNSAQDEGGAMCGGTAENCTFIANSAPWGGGIYSGIAINSIFKENTGQGKGMLGGTAKNCTFYDGHLGTEILTENQMTPKSFRELETLITNNYNSEIYLDGNYSCMNTIGFSEGISITQPITIHGNGYTINGKGEIRIFDVKSDNVIFENITFINAYYYGPTGTEKEGAINGNCTAINCTFKNNPGGAMNGGTAINCTFINSEVYNTTIITPDDLKTQENIKTYNDLNNLINGNNDTEIYLNENYTYDDSELILLERITIKRTLTIDGQGHTINANGQNGIFNLEADNIHLKNMNFINSAETAIRVLGNNIKIANCTFIDNNDPYSGGAIDSSSPITIENCHFENNTANVGGAISIFNYGKINNCTFTNNYATNEGGAIYSTTTGIDIITIDDSYFNHNIADYGGAIYSGQHDYLKNSFGMFISNCNFTNNIATSYGAVISGDHQFDFDSCNLINNTNAMGGHSVIDWSMHKDLDGREDFSDGPLLVNCLLENNTGVNFDTNKFNMKINKEACIDDAQDNTSDWHNAAIYVTIPKNTSYHIHIKTDKDEKYYPDSILEDGDNQIVFTYLEDGDNQIAYTYLEENRPDTYGIYLKCYVGGGCGYIYATGKVTTTSKYGSLADLNRDIENTPENETLTLTKDYNGFLNDEFAIISKTITLDGQGHTITTNDKGINIPADNVIIKNTNFKNGACPVLDCWGTKLTIINCTFINNAAQKIYQEYGSTIYSTSLVTIENCYFENNTAIKGGAIYTKKGAEISNSTFNRNNATEGGAIYSEYEIIIENCHFENNTANEGGSMYINSNGKVNNCTFINNYVTNNGGALYIITAPIGGFTLTDCKFDNNIAHTGGALYLKHDDSRDGSGLGIYNCNFTNNHAIKSGAVIHGKYKFTFKSCNLINNTNDNEEKSVISWSTYKDQEGFECFADGPVLDNCLLENNTGVNLDTKQITIVINKKAYINDAYNNNSDWQNAAIYIISPKNITGRVYIFTGYGERYYTDSMLEDGDKKIFYTYLEDNSPGKYQIELQYILPCGRILTYGDITTTKTDNNNVTLINSTIDAPKVTTVYNGGKYLVVTLKDENNKFIGNADIIINLNGKKTPLKTNEKGQVKLTTDKLAPKTYTAIINYDGDDLYKKSTITTTVIVKKATPKLTASKKTFKKSVKTKKYTVTLKTNKNKVMKNTKITLKVKGHTYTAKTNSKGVATFKLTKLTKKGKYTAVVKYAGSAYYIAKTVKPKITVK